MILIIIDLNMTWLRWEGNNRKDLKEMYVYASRCEYSRALVNAALNLRVDKPRC